MRILIASAFSLLALTSLPAAAEARPCPYDWVQVCVRTKPYLPPRCYCKPGSTGGGGKAEIHKRNVPTVKPNKSPGPND